MKKLFVFILLLYIISCNFCNILSAQDDKNPINTTVPVLSNNPDAEFNGMANIGVVAIESSYSCGLFSNPALLNIQGKQSGLVYSYNSDLKKNIAIKYSPIDRLSIGYSYLRIDLDTIQQIDSNYNVYNYYSFENYHSLRFGYSLNSKLCLGLGVKYFTSDLFSDLWNIKPVKSFAFDLGVFYSDTLLNFRSNIFKYSFGSSIINLGPKISYDNSENKGFIPTKISWGGIFSYSRKIFFSVVDIGIIYQLDKLLVPTPPIYDINGEVALGRDPDRSVVNAMFSSFNDAPFGAEEEKQEFIHHFGLNVNILVFKDLRLSLRSGRYYENENKGNIKFLTWGTGLAYKGFFVNYGKHFRMEGYTQKDQTYISAGYMFKINFKNK